MVYVFGLCVFMYVYGVGGGVVLQVFLVVVVCIFECEVWGLCIVLWGYLFVCEGVFVCVVVQYQL